MSIYARLAFFVALALSEGLHAQGSVAARIVFAPSHRSSSSVPPAVVWLEAMNPDLAARLSWKPEGPYRLVQKDKMFTPHLLVVPVGALIAFPNADPFFHNVFSLFDGKRFDLGLYEAGASKDVRFDRPGISYLFCNIHPQMSAVVVVLQNPLFAVAKQGGVVLIQGVPPGEYRVHLWVEGADEHVLAGWTHSLSVKNKEQTDAGQFLGDVRSKPHLNKFGQAYKPDVQTY